MIGKTLNHYKILEKIGSGGMGDVYVAEDTKLSRKVALKVLRRDHIDGQLRFLDEVQILGQLEHPNIVPLHDLGVAKGAAEAAIGDIPVVTVIHNRTPGWHIQECWQHIHTHISHIGLHHGEDVFGKL